MPFLAWRFVNIRLVLSTIHDAVLVPSIAPQMAADDLRLHRKGHAGWKNGRHFGPASMAT